MTVKPVIEKALDSLPVLREKRRFTAPTAPAAGQVRDEWFRRECGFGRHHAIGWNLASYDLKGGERGVRV